MNEGRKEQGSHCRVTTHCGVTSLFSMAPAVQGVDNISINKYNIGANPLMFAIRLRVHLN